MLDPKFTNFIQKYKFFLLGILILTIGIIYAIFFENNKIKEEAFLIEDNLGNQKETDKTEQKNLAKIVFHIDGAIKNPGVYSIVADAYLYEAVKLAGNSLTNADLSKINLAEKVRDGQKIFIPFIESYDQSIKTTNQENSNKKINLNQASLAELTNIKGVGPKTAESIIKYRNEKGSFGSIEELKAIKGIGEKKFETIKDFLTI